MRRKRSGDALRWSCQSSHSSRAGEGPVTLGPMGSWTTRLVGSKGPFFFGSYLDYLDESIIQTSLEVFERLAPPGSIRGRLRRFPPPRSGSGWLILGMWALSKNGVCPPNLWWFSMGNIYDMIWYVRVFLGIPYFLGQTHVSLKLRAFRAASANVDGEFFSALRASQLQKRLQRHITTAIGQLRYCYDVVPQKKINHCLADAELHLRIRSVKRPFDECRCLWSGNWPAWTFCKLWLCVGAECLQGIQAAKHREKGTPKARFCQISKQRDSWTIDNDQIWTCIRNSVVLIIFIHNNY